MIFLILPSQVFVSFCLKRYHTENIELSFIVVIFLLSDKIRVSKDFEKTIRHQSDPSRLDSTSCQIFCQKLLRNKIKLVKTSHSSDAFFLAKQFAFTTWRTFRGATPYLR